MSHTPGPWLYFSEPPQVSSDFFSLPVVVADIRKHGLYSEANGVLVAAAPDLLKACKLMRSWLLHSGGWSEAIEAQIDPIIAKAEGKTKCG